MPNSSSIRHFASDLIANAPAGEQFDAQALLNQYPELKQNRSIVLNLAFEEYCRRLDEGDVIRSSEFAGQFDDVRRSLLRLIEVEKYIRRNSELTKNLQEGLYPDAGSVFLGFQLEELIGKGALSRVFIAKEVKIGDRTVVAKVCRRGKYEADKLGRLDHAGVVPVHSINDCDETRLSLICMPLITRATMFDAIESLFRTGGERPRQGADLIRVVRACNEIDPTEAPKPVSLREQRFAALEYSDAVTELGIQIAEALDYTHRQGIYHCDIKPTNILLTHEGQAMLLDFNLSVQIDASETMLGGTLPYMAPEQLRMLMSPTEVGQFDACPTVDVFSLGATLFELLTGELPFGEFDLEPERHQAARQLYQRQQDQEGRIVRRLRESTHRGLAEVVADCLKFDAGQRPRTAAEVVQRLRQLMRRRRRVVRWLRSHRRQLLAAVIVMSSSLLFFAQTEAGHYRLQQLGLMPETPGYRFRMNLEQARAACETSNWSLANRHYEAALAAVDNSLEARFEHGKVLIRLNRISEASNEFLWVSEHTSSGVPLSYLGYCHLRESKFAAAESCLRIAWTKGCKDIATVANWGYAATKTLNHSSLELLDQSLSRLIDSNSYWFSLHALVRVRQIRTVAKKEGHIQLNQRNVESEMDAEELKRRRNESLVNAAKMVLNHDNMEPFASCAAAIALIRDDSNIEPTSLQLARELLKKSLSEGLDADGILRLLDAKPILDPDESIRSLASREQNTIRSGVPILGIEPRLVLH